MKVLILKDKINSEITSSSGKMRIEKEDFYKLKQIDRIEYRQRYDTIENYITSFDFGNSGWFILIIITLLLSTFIISYNITEEVDYVLLKGMIMFLFLLLLVFIIEIGSQIYSLLLKLKLKKELNEEYFKVEVKK